MTDAAGLNQAVAAELLFRDADFIRRYFDDVAANPTGTAIPNLCMLNYIALVVHEGSRLLARSSPELSGDLVLHGPAIAQSRHSVKLFDDSRRGLDGVEEHIDHLTDTHKEKFLGNTWLPPARFLERDLGLFTYNNTLVGTSHYMHFNLGLKASLILDDAEFKRIVHDISTEYGAAIAALTAERDYGEGSFIGQLNTRELDSKDVRAARYYSRRFDPSLSDGITAALIGFQATLNALDKLLALDRSPASRGTLTKFRTATLFHVLSGVRRLRTSGRQLNNRSQSFIESLLNPARSTWLDATSSSAIRNTLVHYGPDTRLDHDLLDPDLPLCGVIEAAGTGLSFDEYAGQLQRWITEAASVFNAWSDVK